MDPKFQQLRAFYYAYRLRSFTKAGERLHLTQSAMSRLIGNLEEALGQRLFDRTGAALESTDAADEAIPVVERIIADVAYLKTTLTGHAERRRGLVKFTVLPTLAAHWMPDVLSRFLETWVNVEVEMIDATPDRLVELVLGEVAQFGIVTHGERRSELEYSLLVEDFLCVACRADSPLGRRQRIAWEDLRGSDVISTAGGAGWPDVVLKVLAAQDMAVSARYTTHYSATALAMAARGHGVTILPSSLILGAPRDYGLVARKLHGPVVPHGLHAVTKARRSISPAGRALLDLVRTRIGQAMQAAMPD